MIIDNPYLTEPCLKCNTTGTIPSTFWGDNVTCHFCKGVGYLPNEQGKKILELIKLYVR